MRVRVYLNHLGSRIPVGILAQTEQGILFEYHSEFLERGIPLSPYFLPLRPGIFFDERQTFDGLFGVFNDSLPDGWGLLLFDRARSKRGVPSRRPAAGTTDARGKCAMGALEYEPDASAEKTALPSRGASNSARRKTARLADCTHGRAGHAGSAALSLKGWSGLFRHQTLRPPRRPEDTHAHSLRTPARFAPFPKPRL